jgi:hypothetical protein
MRRLAAALLLLAAGRAGDARQLAQLVRLRGKETRGGLLDDDLIFRKDPVQPPLWIKARIER